MHSISVSFRCTLKSMLNFRNLFILEIVRVKSTRTYYAKNAGPEMLLSKLGIKNGFNTIVIKMFFF